VKKSAVFLLRYVIIIMYEIVITPKLLGSIRKDIHLVVQLLWLIFHQIRPLVITVVTLLREMLSRDVVMYPIPTSNANI